MDMGVYVVGADVLGGPRACGRPRGRFRVRGAGILRAKPSGLAAWTRTRGHEISGIAPCLDFSTPPSPRGVVGRYVVN